jgi:hypothetical protein
MDNICLNEFFRDASQMIRVTIATEVEVDPFEHNVELTELPSIPIRAIVQDLIASQAQWKLAGIVTEKAKEIMVKKNNRSLIEQSYKIEINGETYHGWKINGRMQIREEGDFIRLYVYIKKEKE